MGSDSCPFCKEEIKHDAVICRYCGSKLHLTLREAATSAIEAQIGETIVKPKVTPCRAWCYSRHSGGGPGLTDCLEICRQAEALATVAAKLHRVLGKTFIEIVWEGGDIDPKPFERSVRKRFSRPP